MVWQSRWNEIQKHMDSVTKLWQSQWVKLMSRGFSYIYIYILAQEKKKKEKEKEKKRWIIKVKPRIGGLSLSD